MANNISRLQLRNHTYYIRVSVPDSLKSLVKKNEIRYSLNTKSYLEALSKLRIESAKIEIYFSYLRELAMKISENAIILTDDELEKVLAYRLRIIDDFFDDNYNDIKKQKVGIEDIGLFTAKRVQEYNEKHRDPNVPDTDDDVKDATDYTFIKATIQDLLFDYLKWLQNRPDVTLSISSFIEKINKDRAIFFQLTKDDEGAKKSAQMLRFYRDLNEIDASANGKIENILHNTEYETTPKIRRLLKGVRAQKQKELFEQPSIMSKWEDVFEDMIRPSQHSKSVTDSQLKTKKQCLSTIFELINKQYVEQITFEDCKRVNKQIYFVPKRWQLRYPNQRLLNVLLSPDDAPEKAIGATTISKYLTIFQEFLKFCRTQRLINSDMSDIFKKPKVNKNKNVWLPFENDELKQIFNPKVYFKKVRNKDNAKYWIPLISLYSGARLNEICQLRVNDFRVENGINYFCITDEGDKQSVKNFASQRRVPVHSVLIQLGLLSQVEFAKKQGKDRVFYSLKYTNKNRYAGSMSNAFRYYLDHKVNIKNSKKVFHSFRHTARTCFLNNNVSEEMANIICGWEGKGAGAKNYLHREKVDIKKISKSVEKLRYPDVEEMLFSLKK